VASIDAVGAREILDSRGNPTVEVEVALDDGTISRAAVPSGASTGQFEASELRDGDKARYGGKGVQKAVLGVLDEISDAVVGFDASEQRLLDQTLIDLDGTPTKSRLGANAILGVSLAVARAAAESPGFRCSATSAGRTPTCCRCRCSTSSTAARTPTPTSTSRSSWSRRSGAATFSEALRMGTEVYHSLKSVLKGRGLATGLGDEGGFAPNLPSNRDALDLISEAVEKAGLTLGTDIAFALDVAAASSSPMAPTRSRAAAAAPRRWSTTTARWSTRTRWCSIEDPLDEDDWDGWKSITDALGARTQIVGDDLFVTNPERLQRASRPVRPTPCW
jgi:enolase